jgi:hypothetical protein
VKINVVSEEPAATPDPGPEQPSRYDRSFSGLLAAMIVTVLFVAAYVGFRALTRDQPDVDQKVDYLSDVKDLEEAGVDVIYPCQLPEGWQSTSTTFERGTPPKWGIGIVTDDDKFVGIRQEDTDVDDLLDTYVDENPQQGDDASPANHLRISIWQTWSDSGGDHAFSATTKGRALGGQILLVYGSASVAQQEELIDLLTTLPIGNRSGQPC